MIGTLNYALRQYTLKDVRLMDSEAGAPPVVVKSAIQEWPLLGGHVWVSIPSLWDTLVLDM